MAMRTLTIEVDENDEDAILKAIAIHQRRLHKVGGACMLPTGESDIRGGTLGEICRDWIESHE